MIAKPIIPGRAYRVQHSKYVLDVVASGPIEAIIIMARNLNMIEEGTQNDDRILSEVEMVQEW